MFPQIPVGKTVLLTAVFLDANGHPAVTPPGAENDIVWSWSNGIDPVGVFTLHPIAGTLTAEVACQTAGQFKAVRASLSTPGFNVNIYVQGVADPTAPATQMNILSGPPY